MCQEYQQTEERGEDSNYFPFESFFLNLYFIVSYSYLFPFLLAWLLTTMECFFIEKIAPLRILASSPHFGVKKIFGNKLHETAS